MKMISSTPSRSSCLFYAIRKYFQLCREGYHPEIVYTHHHFKVYLWTKSVCKTYEFCTGIGNSSLIYMLLHFLPIFKGQIIISEDLILWENQTQL